MAGQTAKDTASASFGSPLGVLLNLEGSHPKVVIPGRLTIFGVLRPVQRLAVVTSPKVVIAPGLDHLRVPLTTFVVRVGQRPPPVLPLLARLPDLLADDPEAIRRPA
jgi:hypothetical protein